MLSLYVNHKDYSVDADPNMQLLWVLRDMPCLTGTKFGCGMSQCGDAPFTRMVKQYDPALQKLAGKYYYQILV